jgi:hypothetical protein
MEYARSPRSWVLRCYGTQWYWRMLVVPAVPVTLVWFWRWVVSVTVAVGR